MSGFVGVDRGVSPPLACLSKLISIFNFKTRPASPSERLHGIPVPPMSAAHANRPPSDCRCQCGSLLARLVDEGVEIKCRRCKQTTWLPLEPPVAPSAHSTALAGAGRMR